jgi:hypothetical protein
MSIQNGLKSLPMSKVSSISYKEEKVPLSLRNLRNSKKTSETSEMDQILLELRELRELVSSLQGPETPVCGGITGKGTQCRNRASPDSCYCRMHGERPPRPEKPKRVKKDPKPKKVQPEHTHGDGGVCRLCETHGDVWDPALTECGFEGAALENNVGQE